MGKNNKFLCGCCKKQFTTEESITAHVKAVHKNKYKVDIFKLHSTIKHVDDEPSMADKIINAQLQQAMGEPVEDDWLLDSI